MADGATMVKSALDFPGEPTYAEVAEAPAGALTQHSNSSTNTLAGGDEAGGNQKLRPPTRSSDGPTYAEVTNAPTGALTHGRRGSSSSSSTGPQGGGGVEEEEGMIRSSIPEVPVTVQRKPFQQPEDDQRLAHTGTARANIAATYEHPEGTTKNDWARRHKHQTVLQQHIDFFDFDRDGVIWPQDTFRGFYALGFGVLLSLLAVVIIHSNFSYPTVASWLPDPFFRICTARIHKDKHGSDSGTYDTEGRFIPQKFEDMFAKYAGGRDHLTLRDVGGMLKGQRLVADPIGWGGALFEWLATYILLWPKDGKMAKEDIRGVYDGSIFYTIAERRKTKS